MRFTALFTVLLSISLFVAGCSRQQTPPIAETEPYPNDTQFTDEDYWARENFDLQRVGNLLEESDSPEEFERYLNDDEYGVNNLDLNGDGFADYVSVEEFDDRDNDSRGLSLFTRFGPDLIQEVARIFFYRDRPDYPGSRVLLVGDDRIYGDNYYYETNWLDRGLPIASFLFDDHDRYVSPYYYDNYPTWYEPYQVVETPIYRTRIVELYPEPVFVQTSAVPTYYSKIKIKSPYEGKWVEKVHAKLAKPTKEQEVFFKNNPSKRQFAKRANGEFRADDKPGRVDPPRSDRGDERGNPGRDERGAKRGNPDHPVVPKGDRGPDIKPGKVDKPGKGPDKVDKPGKGPGGGNPNKGGGGGKKP